mgnify:CR=1 FL=1|jgi:hypothetical protein
MKTTDLLKITVYASLIIQVLTGIGNIWILQYKTTAESKILRELIYTELVVQIIEVIFYFWLAYNFLQVKNITPKRYYDWMLTTPTMLITLIGYFVYMRYKNTAKYTGTLDLSYLLKTEGVLILIICILNALMLISGYLGEIGILTTLASVSIGFVFFFIYFYLIYENYVKGVDGTLSVFSLFVFVWSFYGIAAMLSYEWKNMLYNILDLFSKNFFGVFLTYVLYKEYIN